MNNYTIKTVKSAYFSVRTPKNCTKHSRCNNWKECPHCNRIREKKIKKSYDHLTENQIKKYHHKKYIVITSKDLDISVDIKLNAINLFIKDFIAKKINKNFCINKDSDYFITKEISYKKGLGYNPHLNIVLLQNMAFDIDNKQLQKLLDCYNLDIYVTDIVPVDKSYLKSVKKIISYSIKFDKDRASLERTNKITYNQRDIFKSNLFKKKKNLSSLHDIIFNLDYFKHHNIKKSQTYLYNYIQALKAQSKKDLREAKDIFRRNTKKTSAKNYLRMLKSLKKKKNLIILREARKTRRVRTRMKANFQQSYARLSKI